MGNKNKYIQSARLNGKPFNRTWIKHSEIMQGGTLEFDMGLRPNKEWGTSPESIPPSFQMKNSCKNKLSNLRACFFNLQHLSANYLTML